MKRNTSLLSLNIHPQNTQLTLMTTTRINMTVNNEKAYEYIMNKDTEGLDTCEFHTRALIERVKNNIDALEFLLEYIGSDPGANSGFFTDIADNRTFDLYKEYEIEPLNLYWYDVTKEQWKYMREIDYIDNETYRDALEEEREEGREEANRGYP